ncbi:MAG: 16S rRNA (uracil(1498)-N(3))-methyltransferase [Prolixibacteraceae bacterium]|jgi:16S rRNA (uracil1498-N3)-methyltransferase|nr:16S rRNA (uracil(1498)-N(3))-methyltransferase [Prolixibacteraceae bacterium]MBT6766633.1 16S rRNA (uracil(1498)-N(3))-methyltransferase [Prolixibacteraceae bacterium]MBT6997623.1 16S rRNA (uracil(1498)-N(3))-methyltransferase [Prolixibacteraceae bacterium]MBT7394930.1 16S rRNA (uracil(1498)-N(3))-methyltransferase [Prolixibacteraceae bacterium]
MQLFYVPNISGAEVILDETESKHAVKVLRLFEGNKVQVIDGNGGFYEAVISDAHPKKCKLLITNSIQEFEKRNFKLHIAIAPTKNIDRFEWFLEKCTEIGIDEITPLLTEHSERKIIKPERLEKILVAAMKQSLKAYLPKLNQIKPFNEFITNTKYQKKYIAHCYEGHKTHLKDLVKKGEDTLILIGPEGDFNQMEIDLAIENGFTEISLGTARLRTETAGVVACNIVNLANE